MLLIVVEQGASTALLHPADYLVTENDIIRDGIVLIKRHRKAKGLSHDLRPRTLRTPTMLAYRHDDLAHTFYTEGMFVQHFPSTKEPTFIIDLNRPSIAQCWQVFHGLRRVSVRYVLIAPHGTQLVGDPNSLVQAHPGGIWHIANQAVEVCNGHAQHYDPALVSVFFFQAH